MSRGDEPRGEVGRGTDKRGIQSNQGGGWEGQSVGFTSMRLRALEKGLEERPSTGRKAEREGKETTGESKDRKKRAARKAAALSLARFALIRARNCARRIPHSGDSPSWRTAAIFRNLSGNC